MPKKQNQQKVLQYDAGYEDRVYKVLANLTHRDLQIECVKRGIGFEDMLNKSHQNLVAWFFKNFENTLDESNLKLYDAWKEEQLIKQGYTKGNGMLAPCLRLSYTKGIENLDKPKDIKPNSANNIPKEKKPKAEVDQTTGVRKGTKKSMTVEIAIANPEMSIEDIIEKVQEKFPDAEPKSVKIWVKKYRKLHPTK